MLSKAAASERQHPFAKRLFRNKLMHPHVRPLRYPTARSRSRPRQIYRRCFRLTRQHANQRMAANKYARRHRDRLSTTLHGNAQGHSPVVCCKTPEYVANTRDDSLLTKSSWKTAVRKHQYIMHLLFKKQHDQSIAYIIDVRLWLNHIYISCPCSQLH